jgi:hypothetical protein
MGHDHHCGITGRAHPKRAPVYFDDKEKGAAVISTRMAKSI